MPLGPRTVVVAGDDARQGARMLAEAAGWPLLAEPSSGSRTGAHALRCYRLLLDGDLGRRIERVVVAGHPTLSRPVLRLLSRDDVEVLDMEVATRPYAVAGKVVNPVVDGPDDPAWFEEWLAADASVAARLDALLAAETGLTPYAVAGAVSRALPPGGQLVVGSVQPDPGPGPDGHGLPGREPAQGDRQPWPVRHRRHRLDRDRRVPGPQGGQPQPRPDGGRDLPPRQQRPRPRAGRTTARPDDRGRQRRRRVDLRDARAGRTRARARVRAALRDAARRRPRGALRGDPDAALEGRQRRRARARPGQSQRGHRGRRGRRATGRAGVPSTSGSAR